MDTKELMRPEGRTELSFAPCCDAVNWRGGRLLPKVISEHSWLSIKYNDLAKVVDGVDVDAINTSSKTLRRAIVDKAHLGINSVLRVFTIFEPDNYFYQNSSNRRQIDIVNENSMTTVNPIIHQLTNTTQSTTERSLKVVRIFELKPASITYHLAIIEKISPDKSKTCTVLCQSIVCFSSYAYLCNPN